MRVGLRLIRPGWLMPSFGDFVLFFLFLVCDECLKHSYYTHVGFSFSRLFYSDFIVFVARLLNWCLVWMQVHWSKKADVGSNFGAYGGYA